MTKEQIIKFRDEIAKGVLPLRIITDNEHVFYDNCKGFSPIIWDDDAEIFSALTLNYDNYSAGKYPYLLSTATYDEIQFLEVAMNNADAMKILPGIIKDDEVLKAHEDYMHDAGSSYSRTPRPTAMYPNKNPAHNTDL